MAEFKNATPDKNPESFEILETWNKETKWSFFDVD